MASLLANPIFTDAEEARCWLETQFWPDGVICPHCSTILGSFKVFGPTARDGLYMCNACRKQFTVTVGTIFERSHVPLNKWLLAIMLMSSARVRPTIWVLQAELDVSYKTAWLVRSKILEAIASPESDVCREVFAWTPKVRGRPKESEPDIEQPAPTWEDALWDERGDAAEEFHLRNCNMCRRPFRSDSKFARFCEQCRKRNDVRGGF